MMRKWFRFGYTLTIAVGCAFHTGHWYDGAMTFGVIGLLGEWLDSWAKTAEKWRML